ncbi:Metallo-dependent hydrolase [Aureobasidium subglaciale]|nr:Metallo-dependent hydrolase [Aureobasidium subglaciale]
MSRPLRTGQILVGLASLSATALCANSTLFHEGTIITFDEASQPPVALHGSSLLVTGDSIAKIFESSDDVTFSAGTVIIDVAGKIVSPGFIDTHPRIWLQSTRLRFFYQSLDNWNIPRNSPMSANKAFTLATRSGALALRRPNLGVLATGNKADIVVFDGDSSNLLGWSDPVAVVILHSHVGDIRHVMVGGEWRKRDRQLVTRQNRTEVQTKFLESAKRIQRTWLETPLPEMGGEFNWMSHVDYMDAYAVDAVRGNGTGY